MRLKKAKNGTFTEEDGDGVFLEEDDDMSNSTEVGKMGLNKKSYKGWYFLHSHESCEDESQWSAHHHHHHHHGHHHHHHGSHERPPNPPYCFLKSRYSCDYKYKPGYQATYTLFTRDSRVIIPSYTQPTIAPPRNYPMPPPAPIASGPATYRFLPEGNCGGGFLMNSKGEPEGCDVCSLATCQQLCNDRGAACQCKRLFQFNSNEFEGFYF